MEKHRKRGGKGKKAGDKGTTEWVKRKKELYRSRGKADVPRDSKYVPAFVFLASEVSPSGDTDQISLLRSRQQVYCTIQETSILDDFLAYRYVFLPSSRSSLSFFLFFTSRSQSFTRLTVVITHVLSQPTEVRCINLTREQGEFALRQKARTFFSLSRDRLFSPITEPSLLLSLLPLRLSALADIAGSSVNRRKRSIQCKSSSEVSLPCFRSLVPTPSAAREDLLAKEADFGLNLPLGHSAQACLLLRRRCPFHPSLPSTRLSLHFLSTRHSLTSHSNSSKRSSSRPSHSTIIGYFTANGKEHSALSLASAVSFIKLRHRFSSRW